MASLINNSPVTTTLHGSGSTITTNLNTSIPFTDFLSSQNGSAGTTMPKAYLNIVFFDEQFKFVSENSEAIQVTTEGSGQTIYRLEGNAKEAAKNGYVYIYVNNESDNLVYFDNLQITHERGPLLEESHYYPFGTEMSGISSHSLPSYVRNSYKANGGADCVPRAIANREYGDEEWANNTGLEMYETFYRSYNAQNLSRERQRIGIGKFMQGDPMMEVSMESYAFAGNNPVMFTDLLGDQKDPGHYGYWPQPFYFRSNFFSYMDKNGNKWHHADFMAGTGAEGIPYTEGWGMDGFGDMTKGGGGTHVSKIMWSTNGGVQGYKIMWRINGESGEGNTLDEIKFAMTFKPFSVGMQWDRWDYQNNFQQRNQGWETTGTIIETTSLSYETTEQGLIGAQKLGNRVGKTTSEILSAGKVGKIAGTGLGLLNLGVTVASGLSNKNGWENHHTADAVISVVEIGLGIFESTSPIGWAFGATMFVGNLISEHYTGKTITENLFDND